MEVTNAVHPLDEQITTFFETASDGPFVMVNLLNFKERADYADDPSLELTGREAYEIYGAAVTALIEAKGGRLVFGGDVTGLIVGDVEEMWDLVALVEYPSARAFTEIMLSPEYAEIERHRIAGLAGQLNIRIEPRSL